MAQSRKPPVAMIIETATSWQLIWEPASTVHQSLVFTGSNKLGGKSKLEKPVVAALPPRTLSTRFCQVTRQLAVDYTLLSEWLPIC